MEAELRGARVWEQGRNQIREYSRHRPETTDLYRLVYYGRDDLELRWEEAYQSEYGVLRQEVREAGALPIVRSKARGGVCSLP